MATITIEIGKKGNKKVRPVSFLVCHGKTKKRIPTEIFVTDLENSSNGKKIKNINKAVKPCLSLFRFNNRFCSSRNHSSNGFVFLLNLLLR